MSKIYTDLNTVLTPYATAIKKNASDITSLNGSLEKIKADLVDNNAADLLQMNATYTSRTASGITFTWNSDNTECDVSGTATSIARTVMFSNASSLPYGMIAGKTYHATCTTTDIKIILFVSFYDSNSSQLVFYSIVNDRDFLVPDDAVGCLIAITVTNGNTVNGKIKNMTILNTKTNAEIENELSQITNGSTSKMYSVGNSILTGAVYPNGHADHNCSYEDAPYARIASALNIPEKNVHHTLISSTGLIYDAGNGNFFDNISNADLDGYNYVLTHLYHNDLNANIISGIGNINSTSSDGTLAGVVIELYEYVKSNDCQLILVGIPPVFPDNNDYGASIFDRQCGRSTMRQVDELMHEIANKYHFVYVDWQNLDISYRYKQYTYQNNVHAKADWVYRIIGEYLGREVINNKTSNETKIDFIEDALACGQKIIESANINASGVVEYASGRNLVCYRVKEGALISASGTFDMYGFFEGEPGIGESTYNNNRTLASTIDQIIVPANCMWIAIRQIAGDAMAVITPQSVVETLEFTTKNLVKHNSFDILQANASYINKTVNGIVFTWNNDHTQCAVSGTATANAFTNLYSNLSMLPNGIIAGELYHVKYSTTDKKIILLFTFFDNNGQNISYASIVNNKDIIIPFNAVGCHIRLVVQSGNTVNGTVSNLAIYNAKSNKELENEINNYHIATDLSNQFTYTDRTSGGVTFTWNNGQCFISGEPTSTNLTNLYYDETALPDGMEPGQSYYLTLNTNNQNIYVLIIAYNALGTCSWRYSENGVVHIPNDTVGLGISLRVEAGTGVINSVVKSIHFYKGAFKYRGKRLLVSIIDDDISSTDLVTKFHDACMHNGIEGNYAILTKRLEDGITSADTLLAYEDQGFGMLIHAYNQNGAIDWGSGEYRNILNCRANLAKGLRQMQEYGFNNYKYWITPGGHYEQDIVDLARFFGMNCLISTANNDYNHYDKAERWFIKRISFNPTDDGRGSIADVKARIDNFIASGGYGWLIITTHFNEWGNLTWDNTLDANGYPVGYSRFNEVVSYAKSAGCKFVPFPVGWTYFEPYCID